jgi:hypothetical protein
MKNLIAVIALSYPLLTRAGEPYRLDGEFAFRGLGLAQTRDVEVVPQQEPNRVEELKRDSYTCERAMNFYRCVKFVANDEIPERVAANLLKRWKGATVRFARGPGNVILTNDAPSLTEWDIPDTVQMGSREVRKYQYFLLEGELHKIKLPFRNGDEWFLVRDDANVTAFELTATETGKFRFRELLIHVNFAK